MGYGIQFPLPGRIKTIILRAIHKRIQCHFICIRNNGSIVRTAHPPFQLQAVDSRMDQIGHVLNHAHIFGTHDKAFPAVLYNGQTVIGTFLLCNLARVNPAAGLGARPTVCVPPHIILRQKASSAVRHAHGSMHKGFQLHFRRQCISNGRNLGKRQFSCKHNPFRPHFMPRHTGGGRNSRRLGGNMNFQFRCAFPRQSDHAKIRNDCSIRADLM